MKLQQSLFAVSKMDCPSEERMIRVALDGVAGVHTIMCDLADRRVRIVHAADPAEIAGRLEGLGLGAKLVSPPPELRIEPVRVGATLGAPWRFVQSYGLSC